MMKTKLYDEQKWRREFSNNMHNNINKLGINQKILSERSGISESTISYYMNCKATPSAYHVSILAKTLGCSCNDLIIFN